MKSDKSLSEKLNSIVYSYHKYKLPVKVLDEAYKFYHEEWEEIQKLRVFKLDLVEKTLKEGMDQGLLRTDIKLNIISLILESVSSKFLDYKFLRENNMLMKDAMDEVMTILLYGILK